MRLFEKQIYRQCASFDRINNILYVTVWTDMPSETARLFAEFSAAMRLGGPYSDYESGRNAHATSLL